MSALNLVDAYCERIKGQRHFRCERLHAVIGTHECVRRWQGACQRQDDRLVLCRQCPVGALHARQAPSPGAGAGVQHATLCLRCGRLATRLLKGDLCPSCANREAEWRRGTNGRGTMPIKYAPLKQWRVGIIDQKGRPAWQLLVGQNCAEALARAARAGYQLHEEQPGSIEWNAEENRFEYRDSLGRSMAQAEVDGVINFVPAGRAPSVPARVAVLPLHASPDEAVQLLPVWLGKKELGGITGDWRQIDLVCRGCRAGLLHVRRRGGVLEC